MSTTEAQICEIFESFQGEGVFVGERQVFIRFAGCNLSCRYCDTPQGLSIPKEYKVEVTAGKKDFQHALNPVDIEELIKLVARYDKGKGLLHSLSLTGGEPLLQVDYLKNFLPALKKKSPLPIYLETNGVLPDHLAEVIDHVDIIAFDIKLPSTTGLSPYWKEHQKALEIAYLKQVFVKIVFTRETKAGELDEAVNLISRIDDRIPLVLQPVTPFGEIKHRPYPDQILSFQAIAKRKLKEVRVIPQVQKLLGIL